MIIRIGGNQVNILSGTLNIDDMIGERSTCTFVVRDDNGTASYRKGQPVEVEDDSGVLVFAGVIDSAEEVKPGPSALKLHTIRCIDWHYLADKRIAAKAYENTLAGDIVKDLVSNYLQAEGIGTWEAYSGKTWGDL